MPHKSLLNAKLGKRWDVGFRHNEDMGWRLRVDVANSNDILILIEDIAFDLAAYDAAKDALHFLTFFELLVG
jgi:hypothetical protein